MILAISALIHSAAAAIYSTGFENAEKSAYAAAETPLNGLTWTISEGVIGTLANDFRMGGKSLRLRTNGAGGLFEMAENISGNVTSFSFQYRRYGVDAQAEWLVEHSIDGGITWSATGAITATADDTVATFVSTVPVAGEVRFRVRVAAPAIDMRLNIDELSIEYEGTLGSGGGGPTAIVSFDPPNGSAGVATDASFTITFSGIVVPGTGELTIYDASDPSDNAVVRTIPLGDPQITIFNEVVFITPAEVLPEGTTLAIQLSAGALCDLEGNPLPGISDSSTWSFSTRNPFAPASFSSIGYHGDFSGFQSSQTFPAGFRFTGPDLSYDGDWGTGNVGGFRGNASLLGYQHTGDAGTLLQELVLRNDTTAEINELTVRYRGRCAFPNNGRKPAFAVSVDGSLIPGLGYSTADGDGILREASITGLAIPVGDEFVISWTSQHETSGAGSSSQIGISELSVTLGATILQPTISAIAATELTATSATVSASLIADGGTAITARGFLMAPTATHNLPEIDSEGVLNHIDGSVGLGTFTAMFELVASTSYTVRGYATNSVGTSYTAPLHFSSLDPPPAFTGSYVQTFSSYAGTLPTGWNSVGAVLHYGGAWGGGSTGGFRGGEENPGVLGYQHTGATGPQSPIVVELRLANETGAPLTSLHVSYVGRTARIDQTRSPMFTVRVAGAEVPELSYSTAAGSEQTVFYQVTGLNLAIGEEFTISWSSDRGLDQGSSKQIGLSDVRISSEPVASGGYAEFAAQHCGGQGPELDFDQDGVENGIEYFFGETSPGPTPSPQLVGGSIVWPHDPTRSVASFVISSSPDLTTWTPVALDDPALVIGAGSITYTPPVSTSEAPAAVFVKLSVTP